MDGGSSAGRFTARIDAYRRAGLSVGVHHGWWVVHNCLAHPLIGVLPSAATFKLHDYTSAKLNAGKPIPAPERGPAPEDDVLVPRMRARGWELVPEAEARAKLNENEAQTAWRYVSVFTTERDMDRAIMAMHVAEADFVDYGRLRGWFRRA